MNKTYFTGELFYRCW